MVDDSLVLLEPRLLSRPIVSATLFRPSMYNGPLPRLKPQPDHISGMIHNRRVARRPRIDRQRAPFSQDQDLRVEAQFEAGLAAKGARFGHLFSGPHLAAWRAPLDSHLGELRAAFDRDAARATRPTPPDLVRQLKAAGRDHEQDARTRA
ncbi:hypothetical protein BJV78DRAFT_1261783 [Lactifluus subvellereus]|nr:hypothetical protein BJV78DRAFT_1261783 [Lactifluus subvellereus]